MTCWLPYRGLLAFALLTATLAAAPAPARADSIRCQGGIVSQGDSKVDLLGKCGEPSLREVREEVRDSLMAVDTPPLPGGGQGTQTPPHSGSRTTITIERWTYNFGPSQFLQYVTLEGGKVTRVERGGYGFEVARSGKPAPVPRATCDHGGFHEGQSTFEVLARCGPPAARDARVETRGDTIGGAVYTSTVTVEIWTYDFGPRTLTRRLVFGEGKLVRIETGGYGYSK